MNELINELNKIGKEISEGQGKEDLKKILTIIEKSIFTNEDIPLTASYQNTELIGTFRFASYDPMDLEESFEFLRTVAKVCTVYLRKNPDVYGYYVLQEIKYTLNFIAEELFIEPCYETIKTDFSIKQREYHYQVELYKYEFALLEKIRTLLISMFFKKDIDGKMTFDEEDKALNGALKRIAKNKISYLSLQDLFFTKLRKSNVFNYLRKLRNRMVHSYLNPEKEKNFNLDIYLLYILIFYTFSTLVINLKTDDQLVDVYKQVN